MRRRRSGLRVAGFRLLLLAGGATHAIAAVGCEPDVRDEVAAGAEVSPDRVDTLATTESGLLGRPASVDVDDQGRIWVADDRADRVVRISASGGEVERFGRTGQGPGEFSNPSVISASDSWVAVFDFGNRRVQYLGPDGDVLDSRRTNPVYLPASMDSRGTLVASTMGREGSLAELIHPEEGEETLVGAAPGAALGTISMASIRDQAEEGRVAEEFDNVVFPVLGDEGDVWLIFQSDGTVEHHTAEGDRRLRGSLDLEEVETARNRFLARAADDEANIAAPQTVRWATKARGLLWLMMDAPDEEGSNLVGVEPNRLEAAFRIPLSLESPGGSFALDLEQGRAIVALPEEAALLMVQFGDLPDVRGSPEGGAPAAGMSPDASRE